jgi:hypothetical protein
MTWTYNGAPDTTTVSGRRDAVRRLVKDIDNSVRELVSDEEIAFALGQYGNNIYRAAAFVCDWLATGQGSSKSVGDLSISGLDENYTALSRRYVMLADQRVAPYAGGISEADMETQESDTDRVPPAFTRNLHEDEETSEL